MEENDAGSVTAWLLEVRLGDESAAQGLWNRYYERLIGLARQKLADVPRRVADEEDVVLSAFDSFCRSAAEGRFPQVHDRDDLWRVLVTMTVRKAINQRLHARRLKRGGGKVRGESALVAGPGDDDPAGFARVVGSEPSPELAALVAEELQHALDRLGDESLRSVALWKMEGFTNEEIASKLGCKLRSVERKLQLIRGVLSRVD